VTTFLKVFYNGPTVVQRSVAAGAWTSGETLLITIYRYIDSAWSALLAF